jgi:hypothetical protein
MGEWGERNSRERERENLKRRERERAGERVIVGNKWEGKRFFVAEVM